MNTTMNERKNNALLKNNAQSKTKINWKKRKNVKGDAQYNCCAISLACVYQSLEIKSVKL